MEKHKDLKFDAEEMKGLIFYQFYSLVIKDNPFKMFFWRLFLKVRNFNVGYQ